MKQNDNIAEQIRRNPLSQSISTLNKRGVSIDSFRNNKRTIDSLRNPNANNQKKSINLEKDAYNNSINNTKANIAPIDHSPLRTSKNTPNNISNTRMFLPPQSNKHMGKKTLVLDLDETLVHSDFTKYKDKAEIVINVTIDNKTSDIYVLIRPGTDVFLTKMAKLFEIVVFTASISKYAEPLMKKLDQKNLVAYTLFREHCSIIDNSAVKDLKRLGRDLRNVIVIDNSSYCYSLNRENGFPIKTWIDDQNDRELFKLLPILEFLSEVPDVRDYITNMQEKDVFSYSKAANIMNSYYSNKKRSNELSKSFQYKARPSEDNTVFFNSFNQSKVNSTCNSNSNGNSNFNEDKHNKNIKLHTSAYKAKIDPLVKENVNNNDYNNCNMLKHRIEVEGNSNGNGNGNTNTNTHYRRIKNARHQYNLSDSKLINLDKKNAINGDCVRNEYNKLNADCNYHTKHVSIVLDKDYSPNHRRISNANGNSQGNNETKVDRNNDNFNKKSSSAISIKQKQFLNTPREANANIGLVSHLKKEKGNEELNLTDISKEQYNNCLVTNAQSKYKSPIANSTNPSSFRQNLTYLNRLNDNEKKVCFVCDGNNCQGIARGSLSKALI